MGALPGLLGVLGGQRGRHRSAQHRAACVLPAVHADQQERPGHRLAEAAAVPGHRREIEPGQVGVPLEHQPLQPPPPGLATADKDRWPLALGGPARAADHQGTQAKRAVQLVQPGWPGRPETLGEHPFPHIRAPRAGVLDEQHRRDSGRGAGG